MSPLSPVRLRFAAFELDEGNARLTRNGCALALTPKAFGVLCALARHPGQLLSKDALLDAVWGHRHVSESVLKTTISELRAVLGDDARQPRFVETAARRGYRFIGTPARESPQASVAAAVSNSQLPPAARASSRGDEPRMIGRQPALATLRALWAKALGGERQIVWIVGEAGVGKTTLIREFLGEIDPMCWSHGQCVEQYGAGEPYLPFLEGLGVLCQRDPELPAKLRAGAPTWLMQMPMVCSETERTALRQELAGATADRMARELRECTDLYSMTHPLLFVTEDLHWSDGATLRMLDYLARHRGPARGMWLSSFRLTEVLAGDHPLKAIRHELRLHGLATEIALDSFSEHEVGAYLAERFPRTPLPEPFVRSLHQHTDGLPLFLVNVVEDLVAHGAIEPGVAAPDPAAVTALDVPENLAGVIGRQLARLPPETRTLLAAASVCGAEFRAQILAEVLELPAAHVAVECERLARRQQWLTAGVVERLPGGALDARFGFRHALYKRTLYQGIGALTRAHWHQRAAAALERGRAQGMAVSAAELATHCELSQDVMAALRHYADAAASALRHFAPDEAMTLTARALRLLPRCPDGVERLERELALVAARGVAASQLLGVGSPEAMEAFERAQALSARLPSAPARTAEHTSLGWVLFTRGQFVEARGLAARIQAQAETHGDRMLLMGAYNLLGASMCAQGELVDGTARIEQALEICRTLLDRIATGGPFILDPMVSQYSNLCLPLCRLAKLDTAQAYMDAALARARELRHPMSEMLALWFQGVIAWHRDEPQRVLVFAEQQQTVVAQHRLAQGGGPALWMRGWATVRLGDPAAGLALLEAGLDRDASRGMHGNTSIVIGFAAEALLLSRRVEEARQRIEAALELAARLRERIYLADLLRIRAGVEQAAGKRAAARESLHASIREAAAQQALWPELNARLALCELEGANASGPAELTAALGRLSESFDLPLVQRARAQV